ncbi:SpoIIE family protein phosphatase [Pectinatus frisingensis]|uniref:SpoIIE family protein phosphatase n=1 Tax=Pectinatus frisingensis TaxID=865 RepID=UPI0018C5C213|nr:SpoIIE family protein phosphatase [Pectinatus frisingensis]
MNYENSILLVTQKPQKIIYCLDKVLKEYHISIYVAKSGLEGISKYTEKVPTMVLIDNNLPDLNGMSFTSILKDTKTGHNCVVYVFNVDKFLQNTKADYFFPKVDNDNLTECLRLQVKAFFDKRALQSQHSDEIARARLKQNEILPERVETNIFQVDNVYSPFSELSGDGLDYWTGEDKKGLYGLLFDCTGHDIVSFLQVGEIRALLKKGCKYYQSGVYSNLSEIMKSANEDLFALHGDDTICTAAVIFYFDFEKNILHYCSAGIPSFYIKRGNKMEEILMENYLIGYEPDVEFDEKVLELEDIDEIIFSSDGFSELLFKDIQDTDPAKHDDVSAILVKLKRNIVK